MGGGEGGSFCPNSKALCFTFKGAPNLFSAVFNASPVVKSWSYLCHVNETLIRRILNAVFILCQFQKYICVQPLLQCNPVHT